MSIRLNPRKFLLSTSSFSGVLLFLLIGNKVDVPYLSMQYLNVFYSVPKYILFIAIVSLFSLFSIWIAKKNGKRSNISVQTVKPMEGTFLPIYIGLFVIALEMNGSLSAENIVLLLLLFVFWNFLENVSYFNPFLLIFGYRFYEVTTESGLVYVVISKRKDLKRIDCFEGSIPISNFSFIDIKK